MCPVGSLCSSTSNSDVEQASLGSTDEEDLEIYFSCVIDTEQEEQAEEPSARVHQPGSPLGVTGHQSPKCPALVGEVDTCPVDSPCSSVSSSDVEQASLGSTDEEDPEIHSSCVSDTKQEEQAEEPSARVHRPGSPLGVAGHQSLEKKDEEDSLSSHLAAVMAVTSQPSAPNNRFLEALNYVVSRSRIESGRTLTSDELACYGLPNLSQTCFMNSVLQSLLTPMPFVKELKKQSHQWRSHPKALLFKLLTDINNCFTTKNSMQKKSTLFTFLRTIALHHPDFIKDEQQDAHEFLNTVLEQLSSVSTELRSMATDKEQSYTCPVEAHISFQMLSTMLCHSCGHKSENMEECLNLSVAPEDTIMQGIQLYLKEQLLDYKCDCGASQTTEQRSFFTLPNVLIIHLLRFKWSYFAAQKIHKATCLSRELLLHTNQSSEKTKYTLKSIVNHLGSCTTSGHYICDGVYRNASQGDGNACWVTYDDDIVKETTFNHVCQQRQKTAYLLYYEKMEKV
ncbi:probable ubiquitin carboxyl-terminal hydrolase 16 [Takifugu rubripes]|uniref:probable ubiquitin carboxyl-terminal hydrolase 16 n=1 Tax=Takifugu rubripes TaxID=31033 RepID=UPI001145DF6E|nr:probable ubiquitin carboxyl-terminal hydrolase 16 [Takifugu rubripes]